MSFLGEIKRRKVFQVAAVYAVVAWLTIQIVDVVAEPLNLPDWFDTFVIVLFAIGFPIAVILAWAFDVTPQGIRSASDVEAAGVPSHATGQKLNYITHSLVLIAVGFLVVDQYLFDQGAEAIIAGAAQSGATSLAAGDGADSVQRLTIELGETTGLGQEGLGAELAISPDGSRLVYATNADGRFQLHMRQLDQFAPQPMAGTEVARMPFFSRDGEWVGYISGMGTLVKRVSIRGGPPQTLVEDAATPYGGTWETEDTIIYSTAYGPDNAGGRLMRVSTGAGEPEILASPEPGAAYMWPQILPGGNSVLLTHRGVSKAASESSIAQLSLDTGELSTLIPNAFNARYSPTGHIIFARAGALWAIRFDADRGEIRGIAAPVANNVQMNLATGHVPYDFSADGLLAYVVGPDTTDSAGLRRLVWVDRQGNEEYLDAPPQSYLFPRLSPDGQRLAVTVGSAVAVREQDVWIYDLARGTESRLTSDSDVGENRPVWTPDGQSVAYYSARPDPGIFSLAANGTGDEERITIGEGQQLPEFISPDGTELVFRMNNDLYLVSMEGERLPRPLLDGDFIEATASISPDGRWIAYTSNESGVGEIYVRPFPNVEDNRWQISTDGGGGAHWGPDGRELFYRSAGGSGNPVVMAVNVEVTDGVFSADVPEPLFAGPYISGFFTAPNYDLSADGQRFLMIIDDRQQVGANDQTRIAIVNNWFEELERLVPVQE
jgi:serine/threonine-protein kinase